MKPIVFRIIVVVQIEKMLLPFPWGRWPHNEHAAGPRAYRRLGQGAVWRPSHGVTSPCSKRGSSLEGYAFLLSGSL